MMTYVLYPGTAYDYDYIMAPQRGRPYGANLGSMGSIGQCEVLAASSYCKQQGSWE